MARANGKVTTTVKRLLAIEGRLAGVEGELSGVNTRLDVMTEYLASQGKTLVAIKTLLEETLALRPRIEALEGQRGPDKETLEELIRLFWQEGRIAFQSLRRPA